MARKPQVNYWQSRNGYGCWFRGQQKVLAVGPDDAPTGPTYLAALGEFKALLQMDSAGTAKDNNTVRVVLESYLRHVADTFKPSTVTFRQRYYAAFCEEVSGGKKFGDMTIAEVTPFMVNDYLRRMRESSGKVKFGGFKCKWGNGSVRNFIASINAAFNWSVRQRLITINPTKNLDLPSPGSRGRLAILTPEERQTILDNSSKSLRLLLKCLANSGARPGELCAATKDDYNPALGAIVYRGASKRKPGEHSHKSGRMDKDRTIRFTGEALAIVNELISKCKPGEYVFKPSPKGYTKTSKNQARGKWTTQELVDRFATMRKKLNWSKPVTPYSYRHTFITALCEKGVSKGVIAALCGTSEKMIIKHYDHMSENEDYMRAQFDAAMNGAEETETLSPAI